MSDAATGGGYTLTGVNVSTTATAPGPGLLVRVSITDGGYAVRDFIGLRYGFARSLLQAMEAWANDVQWLITEPREKLGDPLLAEADAYRKALPYG